MAAWSHTSEPEEPHTDIKIIDAIFGNPVRPGAFLPEWRTSTVLMLAQQMYDSRDFSAMRILAAALQDAGCTDEAILTHCRGPGPHVRAVLDYRPRVGQGIGAHRVQPGMWCSWPMRRPAI